MTDRRTFVGALAALPLLARAGVSGAQGRSYAPTPGRWRTFETVTRLDIAQAGGTTQAWVPVPTLQSTWQQSSPSTWRGNASETVLATDPVYGARMVHARWPRGTAAPHLEVVSRVRTQDRAVDWENASDVPANRAELEQALAPTALLPIDGIVRRTSVEVARGLRSPTDKLRAIYAWVVAKAHHEPAVRGCGIGDVRAMLESGNLSGKSADVNALFVALCRASAIPARAVYGIRVAPSASGYRELGANGADISTAQHCRAEVWLDGRGWIAMDPADVGQVMRLETPEWLKDLSHPVVAPVRRALFGAWEGNWMAYNMAHDVALPGSALAKIGFLVYPHAETRGERVDSLDPETFRYRITVREFAA